MLGTYPSRMPELRGTFGSEKRRSKVPALIATFIAGLVAGTLVDECMPRKERQGLNDLPVPALIKCIAEEGNTLTECRGAHYCESATIQAD